MQKLFLTLLQRNLAGSLFILAIIVMRKIFRKAPKWLFCLLWVAAAFRLLLPISLETPLSLVPKNIANGEVITALGSSYVGERSVIYEGTFGYVSALKTGRLPIYSENGSYIVTEKDSNSEPQTVADSIFPLLSKIWLAGMVLMLAYLPLRYAFLFHTLREATLLKDNIWLCENADSPFLLGFFNPKIYLPYHMSDADMANAIAHEHGHIKRKDQFWKLLAYIVLCVHWLNPLMWVAYGMLCRDIETACDESVIQGMEKEELRSYSTSILNCLSIQKGLSTGPLAFGEIGVKERISHVMEYRKPSHWLMLFACLFSTAVTFLFATNPAAATSSPFLESGSANLPVTVFQTENIYIGGTFGEKYLYYYDLSSDTSGPACAKPSCSHEDSNCDAYVSNTSLTAICDGKRYWLKDMRIYCSDIDGSNRKYLKTVDWETFQYYNPQQLLAYRDSLYLIGIRDIQEGTDKKMQVSLLRTGIDDKKELELAYCGLHGPGVMPKLCFADNDYYFGITEWTLNGEFSYFIRKQNLTAAYQNEVYEETNIEEWIGSFAVTEAGKIYLSGVGKFWEIKNGKRYLVTEMLSDKDIVRLYREIAVSISYDHGERYIEIRNLEGEHLYFGKLFSQDVKEIIGAPYDKNDEVFSFLGGNEKRIVVMLGQQNLTYISPKSGICDPVWYCVSFDIENKMQPTLLWTTAK